MFLHLSVRSQGGGGGIPLVSGPLSFPMERGTPSPVTGPVQSLVSDPAWGKGVPHSGPMTGVPPRPGPGQVNPPPPSQPGPGHGYPPSPGQDMARAVFTQEDFLLANKKFTICVPSSSAFYD